MDGFRIVFEDDIDQFPVIAGIGTRLANRIPAQNVICRKEYIIS